MLWHLTFHGGPFDGETADYHEAQAVCITWTCVREDGSPDTTCEGHFTMNLDDDGHRVVLATATAYNRTERDEKGQFAKYELGEGVGGHDYDEERELVGAGVGETPSLPGLDDFLKPSDPYPAIGP